MTDYETWTCPRCGIALCDDPLCGCEAEHDEWCKPDVEVGP